MNDEDKQDTPTKGEGKPEDEAEGVACCPHDEMETVIEIEAVTWCVTDRWNQRSRARFKPDECSGGRSGRSGCLTGFREGGKDARLPFGVGFLEIEVCFGALQERAGTERNETFVQIAGKGVEVLVIAIAETENGMAQGREIDRGGGEVAVKTFGVGGRFAIAPSADNEDGKRGIGGEIVRLGVGKVDQVDGPAIRNGLVLGAAGQHLGVAGHGRVIDGKVVTHMFFDVSFVVGNWIRRAGW